MFLLKESRPFYISRGALNLLGVLPRVKNGGTPYFPILAGVMALGYIPLIMYIFIAIRDDVDVDISAPVAELIVTGLISIVLVAFNHNQSKWTQLMEDITKFNFFKKPSSFALVCRYGNTVTVTFAAYLLSGAIFYIWNQHVINEKCVRPNLKNGFMFCRTIAPIWFPFDLDSFSFTLIFASQITFALYGIAGSLFALMVLFQMSRFLVLHFTTLKDNIRKISSKKSLEENRSRFRVCIQYHIHILRMAEDLNQLFRFTWGSVAPGVAVALGVLENQMTKTNRTGAAIYLFGYFFGVFIMCYCSQKISEASQSVADAVFETEWYNVNIGISKNVKFIIARAQKPLTFTGFPNIVVNYESYVTILKTSYSYLTILSTRT